MLTKEQLDNWFTYHPPTDEAAPKYVAIREAEEKVVQVLSSSEMLHANSMQDIYSLINSACRNFAEVIDALALDSADKTAAIRCVRMARHLLNEAVTLQHQAHMLRMENPLSDHVYLAGMLELIKARMQANGAIACGGK